MKDCELENIIIDIINNSGEISLTKAYFYKSYDFQMTLTVFTSRFDSLFTPMYKLTSKGKKNKHYKGQKYIFSKKELIEFRGKKNLGVDLSNKYLVRTYVPIYYLTDEEIINL